MNNNYNNMYYNMPQTYVKKKKNNGWIIVLVIVIILSIIVALSGTSSNNYEENDIYKDAMGKEYYYNEIISCPNFDFKINKIAIKKKNSRIDDYNVVGDPEWVAVYVTIKNTSDKDLKLYSSQFELINSSGEKITHQNLYYNVWSGTALESTILTPNGSKTAYIPFSNTNTDNSKLKVKVSCENYTNSKYYFNVNLKNKPKETNK